MASTFIFHVDLHPVINLPHQGSYQWHTKYQNKQFQPIQQTHVHDISFSPSASLFPIDRSLYQQKSMGTIVYYRIEALDCPSVNNMTMIPRFMSLYSFPSRDYI